MFILRSLLPIRWDLWFGNNVTRKEAIAAKSAVTKLSSENTEVNEYSDD